MKIRYLFGLFILLAACGGQQSDENVTSQNGTPSDSTEQQEDTGEFVQADKISYILPSPLQVVSRFEKAGAKYNETILNPVSNASNYSSNLSKSMNLGIYGADLAYTTLFGQTQASMKYIKAIKIISDALGMSSIFEAQELLVRFEKNLDNKDSLTYIITDLYRESDTYLTENERGGTAVLVLTGGWVEGLFLATKLGQKNENIAAQIAEQGYSLNNLILLLSQYENEDDVERIKKDLAGLKDIYDKINKTAEENSDENVTINIEQRKSISEMAEILRNRIIQLN